MPPGECHEAPLRCIFHVVCNVEALQRRCNRESIIKWESLWRVSGATVSPSMIVSFILPAPSHHTQSAYTASCLRLGEHLKEYDIGGFSHNRLAEDGMSQLVEHELEELGGRKCDVCKV